MAESTKPILVAGTPFPQRGQTSPGLTQTIEPLARQEGHLTAAILEHTRSIFVPPVIFPQRMQASPGLFQTVQPSALQ